MSWNDTEIKQCAAAREMMCFILSGFWALLDELAGIGISVMSHRKHTMISCLPVGLVTSRSLGIGNTQKELRGGLGKGALHLSTSKSSWRQNFQHGRDRAESCSWSFTIIWCLSLMLIKPKGWKVWEVPCRCWHSRVYIKKDLTFDVVLPLASRQRKWIN